MKLSRGLQSEDGAQLVEFALVLPLLLLVFLGIAEFGFIFQRYEVVTNAAREGARIAILPGYAIPGDVETRIRNYMTAGGVPVTGGNPVIAVTDGTAIPGGGTTRRVSVTYTHNYLFLGGMGAWFGASFVSLPLTAVAEMRNEVIGS
jgi:Flp pilus assembly protein TadG